MLRLGTLGVFCQPARSALHLFYLKEAVIYELTTLHFHKPIKQSVQVKADKRGV